MSDTSLSQRSQAEVLERWWTLRSTGAGERCERPHMIKDQDAWAPRLKLSFNQLNKDALKAFQESPSRVNRLGYETKTSHALYLELSEDNTHLTLTELDLHTLHTTTLTLPLSQTLQQDTQSLSHSLRTMFKQTRTLIPDTLGVSFLLRSFDARNTTGEMVEIDQSSQSFTFTHVSHPNAFSPWDYALNASVGGGVELSQGFALPAAFEGQQNAHKVSFHRYTLDATLTLTGHTPLGAIGLSLGPGLGLYHLSDPRLKGKYHLTGEFKSGLHYTFFLTDKLMGRFTVNVTELGGQMSERVLTHISDVAFMIGYYLPTLQRLPSAALGEGG
jgi:hypothetical protein